RLALQISVSGRALFQGLRLYAALSDIPKKRGSALHLSLSIPQGFALFLGQEMRQFQTVFLNKIGNPQNQGAPCLHRGSGPSRKTAAGRVDRLFHLPKRGTWTMSKRLTRTGIDDSHGLFAVHQSTVNQHSERGCLTIHRPASRWFPAHETQSEKALKRVALPNAGEWRLAHCWPRRYSHQAESAQQSRAPTPHCEQPASSDTTQPSGPPGIPAHRCRAHSPPASRSAPVPGGQKDFVHQPDP